MRPSDNAACSWPKVPKLCKSYDVSWVIHKWLNSDFTWLYSRKGASICRENKNPEGMN